MSIHVCNIFSIYSNPILFTWFVFWAIPDGAQGFPGCGLRDQTWVDYVKVIYLLYYLSCLLKSNPN